MSPFTLRFAVVVIVARLLVVGLLLYLQSVLLLTKVFVKSFGGISQAFFAQVLIIIAAMLALLLGNIHVILPTRHLRISKIGDG